MYGLIAAGVDVVLLETSHAKVALSATMVKNECKDAREISQLLRMGWYLPVHAKSMDTQDTCSLLVQRKLLQGNLLDTAQHPRDHTWRRARGRLREPRNVRSGVKPVTGAPARCWARRSKIRPIGSLFPF
jgi:hypothetical protein